MSKIKVQLVERYMGFQRSAVFYAMDMMAQLDKEDTTQFRLDLQEQGYDPELLLDFDKTKHSTEDWYKELCLLSNDEIMRGYDDTIMFYLLEVGITIECALNMVRSFCTQMAGDYGILEAFQDEFIMGIMEGI